MNVNISSFIKNPPSGRDQALMVIISGLIDSFTCKLDAESFEGADINIGQHNGSMSLDIRLILKAAEVQSGIRVGGSALRSAISTSSV